MLYFAIGFLLYIPPYLVLYNVSGCDFCQVAFLLIGFSVWACLPVLILLYRIYFSFLFGISERKTLEMILKIGYTQTCLGNEYRRGFRFYIPIGCELVAHTLFCCVYPFCLVTGCFTSISNPSDLLTLHQIVAIAISFGLLLLQRHRHGKAC